MKDIDGNISHAHLPFWYITTGFQRTYKLIERRVRYRFNMFLSRVKVHSRQYFHLEVSITTVPNVTLQIKHS